MADPTLCANEDHGRSRPVARFRVSYPDGPYKPMDACVGCRDWLVRQATLDLVALLIAPIASSHGECPHCRQHIPLCKDGTLASHKDGWRGSCKGRHQQPKAAAS